MIHHNSTLTSKHGGSMRPNSNVFLSGMLKITPPPFEKSENFATSDTHEEVAHAFSGFRLQEKESVGLGYPSSNHGNHLWFPTDFSCSNNGGVTNVLSDGTGCRLHSGIVHSRDKERNRTNPEMEKGSDILQQLRTKEINWSKTFTAFGLSFFLFCFIFDMTITYTAYKLLPSFWRNEANEYLANSLMMNQIPTEIIKQVVFIISFPVLLYFLDKRFDWIGVKVLVCLSFAGMMMLGTGNLLAGLGWWL